MLSDFWNQVITGRTEQSLKKTTTTRAAGRCNCLFVWGNNRNKVVRQISQIFQPQAQSDKTMSPHFGSAVTFVLNSLNIKIQWILSIAEALWPCQSVKEFKVRGSKYGELLF